MKAYILDILKKFHRFDKSLDFKTIICNKEWRVFNDSGEQEVYIFRADGIVFITSNGIGTKGAWSYETANESLIIEIKDDIYMLHPTFLDEVIFALKLDGTNSFIFMIEANNQKNFLPKTLLQLENYFRIKEKEQFALEKKRQEEYIKQQELAAKKQQEYLMQQELEEKRRQELAKIEEKKRLEEMLNNFVSSYQLNITCHGWEFKVDGIKGKDLYNFSVEIDKALVGVTPIDWNYKPTIDLDPESESVESAVFWIFFLILLLELLVGFIVDKLSPGFISDKENAYILWIIVGTSVLMVLSLLIIYSSFWIKTYKTKKRIAIITGLIKKHFKQNTTYRNVKISFSNLQKLKRIC